MFKKSIKILLYLIILIFYLGCSSSYNTGDKGEWNLSAIYNPLTTRLHPVYTVYHNSDQSSILYTKLFTSELLFQPNKSGEEACQVEIDALLFEIDNNKSIPVDSINHTLSFKKNSKKRLYTQLPLKTEMGKVYQVRLVTRDKLRKTFNLQFVDIDKRDMYSSQNFSFINEAGLPYFSNVFRASSTYRIKHRSPATSKLFISYYGKEIPIPKATFPLSSDEVLYKKADSLWVLDYNPQMSLQFTYPGLYFFQFDTTFQSGYTAVSYGIDFPKVTSPEEMIDPIAYIAPSAEYNKIRSSKNYKLSTDNFWLKVGGSASRGREMIRIYYNRVYFANYFFTNSKAGWKTDRGMIYVVYGPPKGLKKSGQTETWYYYPDEDDDPISFSFIHKPSRFAYNNYVLDRSGSQDWRWKDAVDSWRRGEIYLLD